MSLLTSSLKFIVRRCKPKMVLPAAPTPREVKLLSGIDNQIALSFNAPMIFIYRHKPSMTDKDPTKILKHALSQTLEYYYPFAGRLSRGPGSKLMVDCTNEGVKFIEAEADVTLDELGETLHPPFPWLQQLYDVPSIDKISDHPIPYIQVTRLKCGGFILVMYLNHQMSDGAGIKQFINAWAEMARGVCQPSIQPVWRRELLMARDPPRITCKHREYEQVLSNTAVKDTNTIVQQSFFLRPAHIAAIRRLVPSSLHQSTTFDLISACFWICRTKALQLEPMEEVRLMIAVNARSRFNKNHLSLVGYYGNCFALPAAVTTVEKLCGSPLGYAVELIRKAKAEVTEEYMHSLADLTVIKEGSIFTLINSFVMSDLTRAKFAEIDFGWGEAVYGGVIKGGFGPFPAVTFIIPHKNAKGDEGLILPVLLPIEDMKRFAKELDEMLGNQNEPIVSGPTVLMST